jgi:signal transduction histidine kinase
MTTSPRAAEIILGTRSPVVIASGPELRAVRNEAFTLLMGDAGRAALDGAPLRELSPELWERARPLIVQATLSGQGAVLPNQLFCLSRNSYADEAYLTISCDPILEDDRRIGVMVSLTETTEQVVGARRNAALREVAATSAGARSVDDAARRAIEAISKHPGDVPFALIYLVSADRASARLVATAAVPARNVASPEVIDLDAKREAGWPVALAVRENRPVIVDDLLSRFGSLPAGDWPFAPTTAVVTALTSPGRDRPDAVLIAGVSARHSLDESYLTFIDLLTKHVAAAVAGGRLHEDEERHAAARAAAASAAAKRRARMRAMKERFAGVLEERTRLAREIHDTLLQGVTGISLNLQAVLPEVRTSPTTAISTLERIAEMAVHTSREARLAVWDLRPQPLSERELAKAVESVARLALGESSLRLQVSTTARARSVPAHAQGAVLRVVQEAVSNVVRHAAARRVRIRLSFRGACLCVKVADDGKGFAVKRDFRSYTGHWGLVGMRERAKQIGASFSVRSAPGQGTVVTLDVPIAASSKRGRAT